ATAMAACPTYNGTYLCKNDSMEQTLNLKTEVVNGQYQYSLDTTTVIADGAVRPIDFQGGIYDIAASCTADKVTVQVKFPGGEGDNEACGTEKWDLFYTLNFSPNGSNITESHFSNAVCASGAVIPSGDEATMDCVAL
ncbi:MAG: hypothetical protein ACXWC9_05360, partial [Pseudobdellovibrionaceae bacterium]